MVKSSVFWLVSFATSKSIFKISSEPIGHVLLPRKRAKKLVVKIALGVKIHS